MFKLVLVAAVVALASASPAPGVVSSYSAPAIAAPVYSAGLAGPAVAYQPAYRGAIVSGAPLAYNAAYRTYPAPVLGAAYVH